MKRIVARGLLIAGVLSLQQLSIAEDGDGGFIRLENIGQNPTAPDPGNQTINAEAVPLGNLPEYVPVPGGNLEPTPEVIPVSNEEVFEPQQPLTIDLTSGDEGEFSQQPVQQAYEARGDFNTPLDGSSEGYVDPTYDPAREAPPFDDNDPVADEYADPNDAALIQPVGAQPENISILNSEHHDVSILDNFEEPQAPAAAAQDFQPQQTWTAGHTTLQRKPNKGGIRWVSAVRDWWGHSSCDDCNSGCQDACEPVCCPKFWEHRTGLNGSFLYLHTTNIDLPYTTHVDGNTQAAVPLAPTNSLDPDYDPGFRVGFSYALDYRSSITANYWFYESSATDNVNLPGGTGFLRPELVHPNTVNVFADRLAADARYDIDFQMVDVNYKSALWGGQDYFLNYALGFRYANLDQDFDVVYTNNDALTVDTEIDFDGYGPRLGLEGERLLGRRGLLVYSKAHANFLVGEFTSNYLQRNATTDVTQAHAGFEDDRIVTQLEYEMGLGWQNRCGTFRVTAGYYIGAWFNSVTTPSFIRAVQASNFDNVDETLTFDGLTARAEVRW
ncbi:MAG: hypothetical protein CMJ78_18950 [Planctomycetaceae bacterium]|nr:hypothetical protein [Planctomycetaceae bacterium]